jgi:hypothetical protein
MPGDLDRKISGQLAPETPKGTRCPIHLQRRAEKNWETRITGGPLVKIIRLPLNATVPGRRPSPLPPA